MSQNLPNMLQDTISKIREMVDVNNVIGDPIVVGDVTIILDPRSASALAAAEATMSRMLVPASPSAAVSAAV